MDTIMERALSGEPRALARLMSRVERMDEESAAIMKELYPKTGRAHTIGVTGSPGAGKSSLTSCLITSFRKMEKKVGIIAVDPSSPYSGGAILGDRLRMQDHALDSGVFIRSMGSRGNLGGLSGSTRDVSLVMDACGYDIILIETVGVGQSEVDVVKASDTVCLVLVPGMGDDVQIMKAGIMEIADLFVVNKCDRDGASKVAADVKVMLDLMPPRAWRPPVSLASAVRSEGIEDILTNIAAHGKYLADTDEGMARARSKIENVVEEILRREIAERVDSAWRELRGGAIEDLAGRRTDPYTLAADILDKIILK
ncbi:GTPase [Synergistales bacterium]|nr:GTPase [Synergistales bacterium]